MLRAPEPKDVDALYLWENDPERLLYGRVGLPYSRRLLEDYVENYNDIALSSGHLRFIFDDEKGEPAGVVDLYDLDMSSGKAFVAIYVDAALRGKGWGTKALAELSEFARDHLGLYRLAAFVSVENEPSLRLFASAGFEEIARLPKWLRGSGGRLVDASMLSLIVGEE